MPVLRSLFRSLALTAQLFCGGQDCGCVASTPSTPLSDIKQSRDIPPPDTNSLEAELFPYLCSYICSFSCMWLFSFVWYFYKGEISVLFCSFVFVLYLSQCNAFRIKIEIHSN